MNKIKQSPLLITMALTSSYIYKWSQRHYLTFNEECRPLLADRNIEQQTA